MNSDKICQTLNHIASRNVSLEEILKEAVRLIHESDEAFHWTGIYELLPENVLRLGPFIGAQTEHVLIPAGQGVCGSAVSEGRDKVVPDVSKEANYLSCSLATRSEIVVLIQKSGRIFGQIDIDSHNLNAFDDRKLQSLRKVADWLAEAYAARDSALNS